MDNPNRLRLRDLNEYVLENIVSHLDFTSFVAVAHRYESLAEKQLAFVRLEKITESVLRYLSLNGTLVQRLDLSDCSSIARDIESLIVKCTEVKDLSVVNSSFSDINALRALEGLHTLRMTALHKEFRNFSSLRSIRKLYIEANTQSQGLVFTLELLHRCPDVNFFHMNLFGNDAFPSLPRIAFGDILFPEKWETLHTVVCFVNPESARPWATSFLTNMFLFHDARRVREWLGSDQECYIYERGHFSGGYSDEVAVKGNPTLSKRNVFFRQSADPFEEPRCSPRSIRVTESDGSLRRLDTYLSDRLTQLDISKCHGDFSLLDRLTLINSSPSLRALACTRCFFFGIGCLVEIDNFTEALRRLKLKQLFIGGVCAIEEDTRECVCPAFDVCHRCRSKTPLDSARLAPLRCLQHLEDLTLGRVNLAASTLGNLMISTLRTVRLCLNAGMDYKAFSSFLRCTWRLEKLRIESPDLRLLSDSLWEVLRGGVGLKELCLITGLVESREPGFLQRIRKSSEAVLERLDLMHIHVPHNEPKGYRRLPFTSRQSNDGSLKDKIMFDNSACFCRVPSFSYAGACYKGRNLCTMESFIGILEPLTNCD